jgi:hypothetical protein
MKITMYQRYRLVRWLAGVLLLLLIGIIIVISGGELPDAAFVPFIPW